jgi:hypothetical protein
MHNCVGHNIILFRLLDPEDEAATLVRHVGTTSPRSKGHIPEDFKFQDTISSLDITRQIFIRSFNLQHVVTISFLRISHKWQKKIISCYFHTMCIESPLGYLTTLFQLEWSTHRTEHRNIIMNGWEWKRFETVVAFISYRDTNKRKTTHFEMNSR